MLPVISGKKARRAFEKAGWEFMRQRGSHMILSKPGVDGNLRYQTTQSLTVELCDT